VPDACWAVVELCFWPDRGSFVVVFLKSSGVFGLLFVDDCDGFVSEWMAAVRRIQLRVVVYGRENGCRRKVEGKEGRS
jgi:hypothetical protein